MQEVAKDSKALTSAFFIVIGSSVLGALGHYFFPYVIVGVTYRYDLTAVIFESFFMSFVSIGLLYFTGFFAEKVFHSKLSTQAYVCVMGHAFFVRALGVVPVLLFVGSIWYFFLFITVLSKLGKLQPIPIFLLVLFLFVVNLFFRFV